MVEPLRKIRKGEPFYGPSESAHSAFIDAAQKIAQGGPLPGPGLNIARPGVVPILNNTGGALTNRLPVVGFSGPLITSAANQKHFENCVTLTGQTPATPADVGRFAVYQGPVADGKIAPAVIDGVTPVLVNVLDIDHLYADIADGDSGGLESCITGGAQLLYPATGTGSQLMYVRLGPAQVRCRVFELKTSLTAGGTATAYARRYDAVAADDVTDTGTTFTVWDYAGDLTGLGRDDAASGVFGSYGVGMQLPGEPNWRIIDLKCDTR